MEKSEIQTRSNSNGTMGSCGYCVPSLTTRLISTAAITNHRLQPPLLLPINGGFTSLRSNCATNGALASSISGSRIVISVPARYSAPTRFRCKSELTSDLAPVTSAAYGFLLLGGGLFAYSKSASKGSLFGGITGAVLMSTAYRLMLAPETKQIGDALAFGSALLFASVFGIRLAATRKIIPVGALLGLSVGALVIFFSAYMHDKV